MLSWELQERRGPLLASILVAPAFVLQHLPIILMDASVGLGSVIVVGTLVMVAVFFRVVILWLYNGSGRSVLVVALFHSAYNSAWGTEDKKFANELLSEKGRGGRTRDVNPLKGLLRAAASRA